MNFLRPDGCMCRFPVTTLEGSGALEVFMLRGDAMAVAKYVSCGVTLAVDTPVYGDKSWEHSFFGSPTALVMSYSHRLSNAQPPFPVLRTD